MPGELFVAPVPHRLRFLPARIQHAAAVIIIFRRRRCRCRCRRRRQPHQPRRLAHELGHIPVHVVKGGAGPLRLGGRVLAHGRRTALADAAPALRVLQGSLHVAIALGVGEKVVHRQDQGVHVQDPNVFKGR